MVDGDPTPRTIESLREGLTNLEKQFGIELAAIKEALKVFKDDITRVPTEVQKAVSNLRDFHDQKFANIDRIFCERDKRYEQLNLSNDKAVTKLENGNAALLKQLQDQLLTLERGLREQFGDLKDRVSKMESQRVGRVEEREDVRGSTHHWLAIAGAVMLVVGLLIAGATFLSPQRVVIERMPSLEERTP